MAVANKYFSKPYINVTVRDKVEELAHPVKEPLHPAKEPAASKKEQIKEPAAVK